jgi:Sulfotransferase domain
VSERSVVWIASYPKSGNTWLRFLICNLAFGAVESAADLNQLAPDLHELREEPNFAGQRILLKTHFPCSRRLPFVERSAAAIYVVRDPADVMLSNYHYSMRSAGPSNTTAADLAAYLDRFLLARGDPRWVQLGMGSWEDNVRSWLKPAQEFPILRLRYEDMLRNTAQAASVLCQFLSLPRTAEQIAAAVAASSFTRLREIEEADIRARRVGIFYKPYLAQPIELGLRFMRAGRVGESAAALSDDQRERFDRVFGDWRRTLGYL